MYFTDRTEAGKLLGRYIRKDVRGNNIFVFGLPRGGVVTAYEVAKILHVPLGIVISRKIRHPTNPEYAIAALSEHGDLVYDTNEIRHVDHRWLEQEIMTQEEEIQRRRSVYDGTTEYSLQGKTAIICDDGIATGLTMRAAIHDIQRMHPGKIIIAAPVIDEYVKKRLAFEADEIIALHTVPSLGSISSYFGSFAEVSDDEVKYLLDQNKHVTTHSTV